ncbi:MAG: LysR family transcriptional regulator [Planctomycetota bacterium]|nr:MAG: LysR family transcriptional regulator [Planctomycetota bacterium]
MPYHQRMIDCRLLRVLTAITHYQSVTAAAQHLHLSQSALSHLVSDYEQRLGIVLLNRRVRPIALTAAGERLLTCAKQVLPALDQAAADLQALRHRQGQRLYLATECYSCLEWLLPSMDRLRGEQVDIDLDLRLGSGFERLQDLQAGSVDLVITPDAPKRHRLRFIPLFSFPMVLVCGPRHPLAQRAWIQPRDLTGETLITYPVSTCRLDIYHRFLEPAGLQPKGRITSELTAIIEQKVASGAGVAALPLWCVSAALEAGRIVVRPLGKQGMRSHLFAAARERDDFSSPLVDAFVHCAQHIARTQLREVLVADNAPPLDNDPR